MPPARARLPESKSTKANRPRDRDAKLWGSPSSESARPPKLQPFHLQKWRLR